MFQRMTPKRWAVAVLLAPFVGLAIGYLSGL